MQQVIVNGSREVERGMPRVDDPRWRSSYAHVGGVRLHYVEAGTGPLVILLHGFPDFWYSWRHQLAPLAAAGYRVVAPDLRGFNLSDKPAGIHSYGLRPVVDDIEGLILRLGASRASVVGHDIGAGVAWGLAMRHPERVERLAILNGPHPLRMVQGLLNPLQLLRSWYFFFFQLPWLPEQVLRRRDFAFFMDALAPRPGGGRWSGTEADAYRSAFERSGALSSMINYYRSAFRPSGAITLRRIDAPVLVLWGDEDRYLQRALAEPSPRWVPDASVVHLARTGHFLHHERPDAVNEHLLQFLARERMPSA